MKPDIHFGELTSKIREISQKHQNIVFSNEEEVGEESEKILGEIQKLVGEAINAEPGDIGKKISDFLGTEIWPRDMNNNNGNITYVPEGYMEALLYFTYKSNNYIELNTRFIADYGTAIIQFYTDFGALELLCEQKPDMRESIIRKLQNRLSDTSEDAQNSIEKYMHNIVPASSSVVMAIMYPKLPSNFPALLESVIYEEVRSLVFKK